MNALIDLISLTLTVLLPIAPAYLLYKTLPSSGNVNGNLHNIRFKLGGGAAGYLTILLIVINFMRPMEISAPRYEMVEMQGNVKIAGIPHSNIDLRQFKIGITPRKWDQEGFSGASQIKWNASIPKKIDAKNSSPWFFTHFVISYPDHNTINIALQDGKYDERLKLVNFETMTLDPSPSETLDAVIVLSTEQ
ncbi:hypothetical protein [Jiella mangrovi]|uniref:Uncharacterized protein n=1 Tax=Jiella mangrovi TaxID=2821407 RepID=A0ABS4BIJ1_9HYPH|nr:hypothetical protein [Jiella mangrovi]MBP0615844.1 hypothetical protein [Jiella mangrovi]